ncbi:hypothetical protein glysoja_034121 [Glycine soja]|uniref:Uncharacterized protein n=1 Tax=Glycine soja TaxID=3848 RepID=A0A0B2PL23_GLYSO|nr:hypothetical protein glysoja_034121 [Glycine soja]
MLLKGSLSKADWLSEAYLLSEKVSSLSKYKTLENVKSESSTLSAQPAHPVRMLSLLALSASKLA